MAVGAIGLSHMENVLAQTGGAAMLPASKKTGRYAEVNGLTMYYELHGAGRPLLLLHGGGSTVDTTFGRILPSLAATRRIIAPEQQGHGHTADIDRPLSFEQMADDTAALLRYLEIEQADLLGFSNGGNVALQLAIRHPHLVRKAIVASAFFRFDAIHPAIRESFKHATHEGMPVALRDAYMNANPNPENLPTLVTKLMAMLLSSKDVRPEILQSIAAPTMIMLADNDIVGPEHGAEMTRLLQHGQLAVFPGSDHGTYLGEATGAKKESILPTLAVAMIEAFLDEPMPEQNTTEKK